MQEQRQRTKKNKQSQRNVAHHQLNQYKYNGIDRILGEREKGRKKSWKIMAELPEFIENQKTYTSRKLNELQIG